jgi:hypothetical protein
MAGQLSGGLVDHSFASLDQGAFVFEKSRHALRGRHTTPTDLCACQPAIAAAADLRGLGIEPLEECPCNRRVIWGRDLKLPRFLDPRSPLDAGDRSDQSKASLSAIRPDVLSGCSVRQEDFSESF